MTIPQVEREGTNMKGGARHFMGAKRAKLRRRAHARLRTCVYVHRRYPRMTCECVSASVTRYNSCHGNVAVRGTGTFPSESLFFLLMWYNTPLQHTNSHTQVCFCFYSDVSFDHRFFFSSSFSRSSSFTVFEKDASFSYSYSHSAKRSHFLQNTHILCRVL